MKKFGVLLLLATMTFSLAACGKKVVEENVVVESEGDVKGDAVTIADAEAIELPEGAKEAYESAIADYTDAELEPIGYLGSQVVAGTNYKYLVKEAPSEENMVGTVSVVVVYQDFDGKAEVTEMKQVEFLDYYEENKKFTAENLAGGWNVDDAYGAGLDSFSDEAFKNAIADYTDYELEPICLMNFDMSMNGMEYFILCKASDGNASGLCVVTVTEKMGGGSEITCINAFE